MKYKAEVNVMPLKALLDPQGKAVEARLHNMGVKDAGNIRIGKHITLEVEAADQKKAAAIVEKACKELLHNPIMESYEYKIEKA
ncbi:MAG: phosphoribosylformylglycinamidine synthase subunit PurS [Bacteroides sp.]|nr:phosphoribosylformylglycinamidine synthase subunit PurS [Bacteroides sp.]MCM1084911.1 phosphoribosylformylglycinamidine synthase subunit PurS [Bacteroides sp.]MCM1168373.1 phosphoribosylformylglycinamidine synthase subunit PurS [Bacteroides sp.]